jgi:hypothetical protein
MIQQARPATVADSHLLVAATERSQILLPRPTAGALIPYADEVDIAVLQWIASHARGVRQFARSTMWINPNGACHFRAAKLYGWQGGCGRC